ncbi:MAG: methyltransferase [Rhizobiales bacterium 17-65-6]|nr:MAG: methyltransferase [Rhizobiales bacterium 12-68-15]OYX88353.1 MAG: methyltransferase [Azorhizobium sp. 32-67-21]OYZ99098.1 MAG: methyltransferase [Rhizobiales bacterium 17-65-6]
MSLDGWTRVDAYIEATLLGTDPVLEAVLAASHAAGLPEIAVSPAQGRLLALYVKMLKARRVLEIGTLGGYSTLCMARAQPEDGRLVTLEFDPAHAAVARANFEQAGLAARIDLRVGRAIDTLPEIAKEGLGPFDLVFIDADKPSNPDYLAWALRLTRPGALIICDNVVRDGAVADPASSDPRVIGTRRMFEMMAAEPRLTVTAIQTVGCKGYDGFAVALVGD